MTNSFGADSTTDDVLKGIDLRGKRYLVTGVSSGIGRETMRALAAHGAEIVGAARNPEQLEAAMGSLGELASSVELVRLNLASLESVRACAAKLLADGRQFDTVIANAGVMATPKASTADGFEMQFGTNHLGHFLFVNLIAPLIRPGGRVVVVASSGHRMADFSLDDLNFERTPYNPNVAYARSKTANILFAVEFDRRFAAHGIRAVAVHPGGTKTDLLRHIGQETMEQELGQLNTLLEASGQPIFQWKTIEQGAATSVWAAVIANPDAVGGRYCENCHVSIVTDGVTNPIAEGVSSYALDPETAKALWMKSEALVNEHFSG